MSLFELTTECLCDLRGYQAFSVEVNYLSDQRAKGKGDQDSADLLGYYAAAMAKFDEFIGLYADVKTNKYLKAYGMDE